LKARRFRSNLRLLLHHPSVFARAYRWPIAILLAGAVLDAATTAVTVATYGAEAEVHLAQRWVMACLGPILGTISAKLIQVAAAVLVASLWRAWCGWLMVLCGLLYTLAAVSNHFLLL